MLQNSGNKAQYRLIFVSKIDLSLCAYWLALMVRCVGFLSGGEWCEPKAVARGVGA